jgi:adenosine kinase
MVHSSRLKAHRSKVLITGSIAYDLLLTYEGSFADALKIKSLDDLSVSFFAPHLTHHHGGTAANIAWNLKLLGGDPMLVGTVGTDGGSYCALLEERGIRTEHIEQRRDGVTATAIICTDDGERQIAFFHPGTDAKGTWPTFAETAVGKPDLSDDRDDISWAIVGARNPVLMMQAVRWCDTACVPLLFDPGQQVIALSSDELQSAIRIARGVICNAYEWAMLLERAHLSAADVAQGKRFLIVTHGERGLTLHHDGTSEDIPACAPERVVNPTGAGDALRGGVLFGLANDWSLRDCCRLGAAMGSFAVEIEGTLMDRLDMDELLERTRKTYGEELPGID